MEPGAKPGANSLAKSWIECSIDNDALCEFVAKLSLDKVLVEKAVGGGKYCMLLKKDPMADMETLAL
jgi:hypothetical protein